MHIESLEYNSEAEPVNVKSNDRTYFHWSNQYEISKVR